MFPVIERAEELTGRHVRRRPRGRRPVPGRRRPRPQLDDADRRRRHPRQRGPRLRAAPAAAPGGPLDAAARRTRTARCPSCCRSAATRWARPTPSCTATGSASRTVAYAEEDAFRQTLRAGTTIFDLAAHRGEAGRRHRAVRRPGLRAARHLRLPDRPDPRDGRRAGARRRRGRLPPADDRAARPGQGRRARPRRASTATPRRYRAGRRHAWARRSSSPATPRWSPRARCAGIVGDGGAVDSAREGDEVELVLDRTPFYAEGGGQLADQGVIELDNGARLEVARRAVADHRADRAPGRRCSTARSRVGGRGAGAGRHRAPPRRSRRAHTATHMVHKAFREALGETATQAGLGERAGPVPLRLLRDRLGARVGDGRRRGAGQRPGARRPRACTPS